MTDTPAARTILGGLDDELGDLVRNDADTYAKAERDGRLGEIPTNRSPKFAPVIHPTLQTGVETLVAASCAWLQR